ncbi:response regulator transcription factor [Tomitella biformata]|uniref:response regulator transcription factor n=1 Tax=Tomitella biformata TaxID=630403 RepID=UPI0004644C87|nr:response regulator transcription factor [Tomitella biformata]
MAGVDELHSMVGVVVFDDDHYRGLGLASALLDSEGIDVVGVVTSAAELALAIGMHGPQVVLMRTAEAVNYPHTRTVAGGEVRVIAVALPTDSAEWLRAAGTRVHGIVCGQDPPELIEEAVRVVAGGNMWMNHRMWGRIVPDKGGARYVDQLADLTDRERQVLVTLASGRSNKEIAETLFLGVTTVKTHISAIMAKVNAQNRIELALVAYRGGLVR